MGNFTRPAAAGLSCLFRLCRTGVLNADDPAYRTMLQGAACTPLLVGTGKDAALRAEQVQLAPDHVAMDVREGEKAAHVRIGIPGRFTVSNALLTLGIARARQSNKKEWAAKHKK